MEENVTWKPGRVCQCQYASIRYRYLTDLLSFFSHTGAMISLPYSECIHQLTLQYLKFMKAWRRYFLHNSSSTRINGVNKLQMQRVTARKLLTIRIKSSLCDILPAGNIFLLKGSLRLKERERKKNDWHKQQQITECCLTLASENSRSTVAPSDGNL